MDSHNWSRGGSGIRCAIWLVVCLVAAAGRSEVAGVAKVGDEAPSFSLPNLAGKREALSIWCGKTLAKPYLNNIPHVVVVSFWETTCKPCMKEMPELARFNEKHQNDQVKVFCISIDKAGAGVVAPFVKSKEITLPILLDPYRRTAERFGVKAVPALFVIGPEGVIRYAAIGYKEGVSVEKKLEDVLSSIRSGKTLSTETESIGEAVGVSEDDGKPSDAGDEVVVGPRQRWKAVANIECGRSPEEVAGELGIDKQVLQGWYNDLKNAALELWGSEQ